MQKWFSLIALFLIGHANAQIPFVNDWDEAFKTAKNEGKSVFLYAYTSWCEPCEEMEEYTFDDLEVVNYHTTNFINLSMDFEEYPGLELEELYEVDVFPTFLYFDENGGLIHRGCGSMNASELLALNKAAMTDSFNLNFYNEKYKAGDRSVDFMMAYLSLLDEMCLNTERFASNYLANVPLEQLSEPTNWAVFSAHHWDVFSDQFKYLFKERKAFEDQLGKKVVDAKIYDTYLALYQEIYVAEELHEFAMRALLNSINEIQFIGSDTLKTMMNLHFFEITEDWSNYADTAIEWVGMTDEKDPDELNDLIWKFYLFVDDKNQLQIASTWANEMVEKDPQPNTIDTYASILFKLGDQKKAIELEKQAIELAKELNEDVYHYEYQLKKFIDKK
jgi:thioredoxin-related protein